MLRQEGRLLQASGGFLVGELRMRALLIDATRDLARALNDPAARAAVYEGLHASPFSENKIHFRTFITGEGQSLLRAMATARGTSRQAVLASLDSIVDLELYMPVADHLRTWNGTAELQVLTDFNDDDSVPPQFHDLYGNQVRLSSGQRVPLTSTLALVHVETDYSTRPAGLEERAQRAPQGNGTFRMTSAWIPDREEAFGAPELEVHAFVRNAQGDFIDRSCAGAQATYPAFRYNQDDAHWNGPTVYIIEIDSLGANPVEFSIWEDDDGSPCGFASGQPPNVGGQTIWNYNVGWGARQVTHLLCCYVITIDTLEIPLVFQSTNPTDNDDEVGELVGPVNQCWPETGPARFDLVYAPGGSTNGYVFLDVNFGQRDPICETPPPAPLTLEILGPTELPPDTHCSWQASVSGGQPGYTYQWSGILSGNQSSVSGSSGQGGPLRVDVGSADGQNAMAQVTITTYQGAPPCVER